MRARNRNRTADPRVHDARPFGGAIVAGLLLGGVALVLSSAGEWAAPRSAEAQAAATKPAGTAATSTSVTAPKPAATAATSTSVTAPKANATATTPASATAPKAGTATPSAPKAKATASQTAAGTTPPTPGSPTPQRVSPATPAPAAKSGVTPRKPVAPAKTGAPATGGAVVQSSAQLDERLTYQYNALGRRDPFQSLLSGEYVGVDVGGDAPPDVGGLKVVGIVWGDADQFALVEDARGDSHILRRGDKVTNGYIEALKRDAMIVNLTVDGQTQSVTVPLTRKGEKTNANR